MSALRGGRVSGLVFDGQVALQVVVCMPLRLVSESPFHPSSACHLGLSVAQRWRHTV